MGGNAAVDGQSDMTSVTIADLLRRNDRRVSEYRVEFAQRTVGVATVQHQIMRNGMLRLQPLARDEEDLALCGLVKSGDVTVEQIEEGRHVVIPQSGGFFLSSRSPYRISWSEETELVVVVVPESSVRSFGVDIDPTRIAFSETSTVLAPAIGFFVALAAGDKPGSLAEYVLGRLSEELVGSLFLERFGVQAEPSRSRPVLFEQAVALIAVHRSDPELDIAGLARMLSVSIRHVQRAFQENRTTVTAQVRRQRIELAVDMLTDQRYRMLTISQIAQYSGFKTSDDLQRALRIEGRPTPTMLRRSAQLSN